jgi:hypothetical protein
MKTVAQLKEDLTNYHKDTDEIIVAYWDREWVEQYFSQADVELTDMYWALFKQTLAGYTKHNEVSGALIEEAAWEVINHIEEMEEAE